MCAFLGQAGASQPPFVLQIIMQLLGRITKLGWLEDQASKDLPEEIKKYFIQSGRTVSSTIGIQLLNNIIVEMNTLSTRKSLTQHRKIAVSFRDLALRGIFETGIFTLREILKEGMRIHSFR